MKESNHSTAYGPHNPHPLSKMRTEIYAEGRLSLGTRTGKGGEVKTGLSLAAWEVQPMGQIGKRKLKKHKSQAEDYDPAPFNDEIPF